MKYSMIAVLLIGIFSGGLSKADPYLAEGPYSPDKYTALLLHFDEAAGESLPQDSSLYGNDAISGPLATGNPGVFGNAMSFANQFAGFPNTVPYAMVQTNGFVEFWMKPDTNTIDHWDNENIMQKNDGGSNPGDFTIGFSMAPISIYGGGSFRLLIEDGSGYRTWQTPKQITAVRWYHVVVAWDSVNPPTISVDGVPQILSVSGTGTNNYFGPIFTAGNLLGLGVSDGVAGSSILIDELRIGTPPPPAGTIIVIK